MGVQSKAVVVPSLKSSEMFMEALLKEQQEKENGMVVVPIVPGTAAELFAVSVEADPFAKRKFEIGQVLAPTVAVTSDEDQGV